MKNKNKAQNEVVCNIVDLFDEVWVRRTKGQFKSDKQSNHMDKIMDWFRQREQVKPRKRTVKHG